jgi:DinB superfamily
MTLTKEEFAELIKTHDESLRMLLGLINGMSDEQWNFKQDADRWSVGECTEHIFRSNRALFDFALKAMKSPPDPEWFKRTKGKAELIRKVMPNRNPGGAKAPAENWPTEKWGRAKAIVEVYKVHGEIRAYLETMPHEIKNHTVEHPFPIFNWLNTYDWLLYAPLHTIRHCKQIIEVQAVPKYPKKQPPRGIRRSSDFSVQKDGRPFDLSDPTRRR